MDGTGREHQPVSLDDYLKRHISQSGLAASYTLSICDVNFSKDAGDTIAAGYNSLWTLVGLAVDGAIGENEALRIMKELDQGIDEQLAADKKPQRAAYRVYGTSKVVYQARSVRIHGELPAAFLSFECYEDPVDGDDENPQATCPATPKDSNDVKIQYKILDLDSAPASLESEDVEMQD
ncbi:hypothetical protein GGR50DRAFT_580617 [Xylaria sp. CBS 124048]|nr:hypothetical protein GGR50DRAFT_580617 [Xylaria sp. CBS 124048]